MSIAKTESQEKSECMASKGLVCIYDFGLFPYALGDVLTWNINTAIRCVDSGFKSVDIYLCLDKKTPANFNQRLFINKNNNNLFFQELYSAFGSHPFLGNIHIFHSRESLISALKNIQIDSVKMQELIIEYFTVLGSLDRGIFMEVASYLLNKYRLSSFYKFLRKKNIYLARMMGDNHILMKTIMHELILKNSLITNEYFKENIYSHAKINEYFYRVGKIPLLQPALGCESDINLLFSTIFAKKKIVTFHLRLKVLDVGFGGDNSYERDSNYLEWYSFLRESSMQYPDIHFVALGRLQEKPLDLLQLPNVTNLRMLGFGLGHELTLINRCDLFIGSSSGFAAAANFSNTPYCVTKVNENACEAYGISFGQTGLPFSKKNQTLSYESESYDQLMKILKNKFEISGRIYSGGLAKEPKNATIDIKAWLKDRKSYMRVGSTTSRFYFDKDYKLAESSFLVMPSLQKAKDLLIEGNTIGARKILNKIYVNFPEIPVLLPQFLVLRSIDILCSEDVSIEVHIKNCLNINQGCSFHNELTFQIEILNKVISSKLTLENARIMLVGHLKKIML